MAEYTKREAAINRIKEYASDVYGIDLDDAKQFSGDSLTENYCEGLYEATELVDDIPAADVAPVAHGLWMPVYESEMAGWDPAVAGRDPIGGYICSACKEEAVYDCNDKFVLSNYCPHCGARMDGGDSNALN